MATPVTRQFRPGQYLFREGESPDAMYLIKKGTVAVRKMKGSAYVEIARVYANEVIGELSFFDRNPRSAAAVAVTEVEAAMIEFSSLDKIYDKVPPYLKSIMICVADRLRKADDVIRRLQKNVVYDEEGTLVRNTTPSTASVLAATSDINVDDDDKDGGEKPSE